MRGDALSVAYACSSASSIDSDRSPMRGSSAEVVNAAKDIWRLYGKVCEIVNWCVRIEFAGYRVTTAALGYTCLTIGVIC